MAGGMGRDQCKVTGLALGRWNGVVASSAILHPPRHQDESLRRGMRKQAGKFADRCYTETCLHTELESPPGARSFRFSPGDLERDPPAG